MLGAKLGSTRRKARVAAYKGPAGGWGSAKAVTEALMRNRVPLRGARLLLHQNKVRALLASVAHGRSRNRGRWSSARMEPRRLPGKSTRVGRLLSFLRIILSMISLDGPIFNWSARDV